MKDKELDEAYHELEKDDQSFEARTIRAYYAMRKDKTQDSDETSEESFTMTNGNREVTVTKDDNGKWVDSDGNKYMGYLSKSEVKSYFKGNWKEAKSTSESAEKSKSNDWVRDAFNKYKKEHPNSKITFETFKKSNIK